MAKRPAPEDDNSSGTTSPKQKKAHVCGGTANPKQKKAHVSAPGVPNPQRTNQTHPIACQLPSINNPSLPCPTRFRHEDHHRTHRPGIHGVFRPGEEGSTILWTTNKGHLNKMNKPVMATILRQQRAQWNALKRLVKSWWDISGAIGCRWSAPLLEAGSKINLDAADASAAPVDPALYKREELVDMLIEIRTTYALWLAVGNKLGLLGFDKPRFVSF